MDASPAFKYDVALSFLDGDEAIAQQLADGLSPTCSVFLYSERQRELAGKDGVDEFTAVFREHARVCVVLFRDGWGATKWTRVEDTAIKDRAFESGWDFLTVVALGPGAPKWLPKTKLWLGFERFGIQGAVAVIEARVREQGGDAVVESARAKSERLGRASAAQADREAFLNSERGVAAAKKALAELREHLQAESQAMRTQTPALDVSFDTSSNDRVFSVSTLGSSLTFGWSLQYSNTLQHSNMLVQEFNRAYRVGGYTSGRHDPSNRETWYFTLASDGTPAWYNEHAFDKTYSSKALGEHFLKRFLDRAHEKRDHFDEW